MTSHGGGHTGEPEENVHSWNVHGRHRKRRHVTPLNNAADENVGPNKDVNDGVLAAAGAPAGASH